MRSTAKEGLFKTAVPPRDKADSTTAAARAIIAEEASARARKTERLRKARLEATPVVEEQPVKARKAPVRKRAVQR